MKRLVSRLLTNGVNDLPKEYSRDPQKYGESEALLTKSATLSHLESKNDTGTLDCRSAYPTPAATPEINYRPVSPVAAISFSINEDDHNDTDGGGIARAKATAGNGEIEGEIAKPGYKWTQKSDRSAVTAGLSAENKSAQPEIPAGLMTSAEAVTNASAKDVISESDEEVVEDEDIPEDVSEGVEESENEQRTKTEDTARQKEGGEDKSEGKEMRWRGNNDEDEGFATEATGMAVECKHDEKTKVARASAVSAEDGELRKCAESLNKLQENWIQGKADTTLEEESAAQLTDIDAIDNDLGNKDVITDAVAELKDAGPPLSTSSDTTIDSRPPCPPTLSLGSSLPSPPRGGSSMSSLSGLPLPPLGGSRSRGGLLGALPPVVGRARASLGATGEREEVKVSGKVTNGTAIPIYTEAITAASSTPLLGEHEASTSGGRDEESDGTENNSSINPKPARTKLEDTSDAELRARLGLGINGGERHSTDDHDKNGSSSVVLENSSKQRQDRGKESDTKIKTSEANGEAGGRSDQREGARAGSENASDDDGDSEDGEIEELSGGNSSIDEDISFEQDSAYDGDTHGDNDYFS